MRLVIRKIGWAIPTGTQVQARAIFADNSTIDFVGRGNGQTVEIDLSADQVRGWVHALTANPTMEVSFGGSEPPWRFDLAGTTRVVDAMGDCFAAHHIMGVAAPFSGTAIPSTGLAEALPSSTVAPTQPYGKSLDAVPTPYSSSAGSVDQPASTAQTPEAAVNPATEIAPFSYLANNQQTPAETPPPAPPIQPSTAAIIPNAEALSCKDDWRRCKDNNDLVNNYKDYYIAQSDCKTAATKIARFGTPIWPGFWSGGSFGTFQSGTNYVSTGVVVAIEPDVQFQNQFGAMVHSTARCEYDFKTKAVLSVNVAPNG